MRCIVVPTRILAILVAITAPAAAQTISIVDPIPREPACGLATAAMASISTRRSRAVGSQASFAFALMSDTERGWGLTAMEMSRRSPGWPRLRCCISRHVTGRSFPRTSA